ncbi:hypothetical protein [Sphaerisporangium aureirubrum]|uniref:Uncharacterized protein n=1 Tax=Sphaerisporangium aureirubrum TaxID=1544736 RepID=A0ABW1NTZ7_9ACTN
MRKHLGEQGVTIGGEMSAVWRALAPWAILLTTLIVAPAASLAADLADMRLFLTVCVSVAGIVSLYVSADLTKGRRLLGRAHELLNVVGVYGLVLYNVAWGTDQYVLAGGLIFGATSAWLWNRRHTSTAIRELERTASGNGTAHDAVSGEWQAFAAEHLPQVADSRMTVFKNTAEVAVAGLEMGPAGVPEDLAGITDRIGRFFGGIAGGTTLAIGEKLDKVGITVTRKDPLKDPILWQGPQGMGESIVEPIGGLGLYRDLLPLELLLPHVAGETLLDEDKQQSHMLMIGMSRTGKGDAGDLIGSNVALRKDAATILLDAVKADQQLGVIGDTAAYVLPSASAIRSFLWKLVNVTIPRRAAFLGNPSLNPLGKQLREWTPGCGLTWLLVHAYEAAALYGNKNLTLITERAASVGIQLVIEAQKGIHDRLDTNARSNAADLIHFGCHDRDDAELTIDPELIQIGVTPWVWKNKRPGSAYVLLSHLPLSRQLIPARFARKARDGSDIAAAWAEYRHLAGRLDPLTAATFGEPYEKFAAARATAADRAPRQHSFAPRPGPRPATVQGAVLLDERPIPLAEVHGTPAHKPFTARHSTPDAPDPAPLPETGFHLDDSDGDEAPPSPQEEAEELARVAEEVIGDIAAELEGHAEAGEVLNTVVDAMEQLDDDPVGPPGQPRDDIEFPDVDPDLDPDGTRFRMIVDRSEAINILLDVLRTVVGEGNTFQPRVLYDELARRARKSDSWVRKCLPLLMRWGCISETDKFGEYEVIHTRRGDLVDYTASPEGEL